MSNSETESCYKVNAVCTSILLAEKLNNNNEVTMFYQSVLIRSFFLQNYGSCFISFSFLAILIPEGRG